MLALRREGLWCKAIVVWAGDQDEAVRRVLELGALAFIRKPAEPLHLYKTLASLGLLNERRWRRAPTVKPSVLAMPCARS
ncbi:hypothetical protein SSTU70S_00250 [Stutzerimonas stutzeri]